MNIKPIKEQILFLSKRELNLIAKNMKYRIKVEQDLDKKSYSTYFELRDKFRNNEKISARAAVTLINNKLSLTEKKETITYQHILSLIKSGIIGAEKIEKENITRYSLYKTDVECFIFLLLSTEFGFSTGILKKGKENNKENSNNVILMYPVESAKQKITKYEIEGRIALELLTNPLYIELLKNLGSKFKNDLKEKIEVI
jgi:hypothetical protein